MSLNEKMTALADAVREKAELTDSLTIDEMTAAVNSLVVNGVEVDARTLTVTPSKSQQSFTSSELGENAYYGTVTVEPIPSEYITTDDATAVSGDILTGKTAYVDGKKVTGSMKDYGNWEVEFDNTRSFLMPNVAGGYFNSIKVTVTPKQLTVTPGSKVQVFNVEDEYEFNAFYTQVTVNPIPSEYIITNDATADASNILKGKTAYVKGIKVIGTLQSVTATLSDNVVTVPQGFIAEEQTLTVPEAMAPTLIKNTVTIHPGYIRETQTVTVGYTKSVEIYTPGTEVITIPAGFYLEGDQIILGDISLTPQNIKTGVSIFNVEGTFTSDADAAAEDIAKGKTAYVNGVKITGIAAGGESFYKCASVEGPQILNFVSVTGAGITDCNGNYSDSGMLKNGQPVYSHDSASGTTWYIYFTTSEWEGDSWVLSDNLNVEYPYGAHYYSSQLSGTWWGGEGGGEEAGQATVSLEYSAVNTGQAKTWAGYRLITAENGYEVAEELTAGLVYGVGASSDYVNDCIMPKVGGIYNSNCTAEICDAQFKTDNALTFTAEEEFSTVKLEGGWNFDWSGIRYSLDGRTWQSYTSNTVITLQKIGDFVKFDNTKSTLVIEKDSRHPEGKFTLTGKVSASGELKSMLNYSEDWPKKCFEDLFRNQTSLTACPDISCSTLGSGALMYTFNGCTNVKKVKIRINELLPREDDGSYNGIDGTFGGCTSLAIVEADLNSWNGFDADNGWLNNVSPKGVFIKPTALPVEYGNKRIPEGWQIVNK